MDKFKDYMREGVQKDVEKKIIQFFMDNPSPPDSKVHDLADKLNIDTHKFEGMIYKILGSILSKKAKITEKINELFIQSNEISNMPKGRERDIQISRLSMIAELDAANLYESMISLASDKDLKTILKDVANEEKTHAGEFEFMLDKLDPEWDKYEDEGEEEAEEKTK